MKKLGLGKRTLACVVSAATLLTGTTALSALVRTTGMTASAASYDNYAKLLQYSMYFYDANMCGDQVGETGQMEWRDDCHTSDAVTGGFHDAGDHVKFGLPAGYTASTLGWGYYEFKDSYDSLGQTAHLKTITDYFAKYFKDCTTLSGDSVSSFIYQIGNGDQDHAVWCAPEVQDASSRQVYKTTNSASDIAAEYAAALAVNYLNFGNEEDLTYAKALYKFSKQYNSIANDGTSGFYASEDYEDDQAWAAGFLYLATNDSSYKSDMDTYFSTGNRQWGEVYYTHCWNTVTLGAAALYGEISGEWKWANSYAKSNCTDSSTFLAIQPWGSARLNVGLQLPALVVSKHTSNDYTAWCKAQMGMILGNNSTGKNLIVGFDENSPKNPHHRAASGYKSNDEFSNQTSISSTNGHVLVGALVGGPMGSDFSTYEDSLQNYTTNEVAIDYNAALVGAAAGLYETYKTGSLDSSIEGTKTGTVVTTPATTEKPSATTTTSSSVVTTVTTTNGNTSGGSEASFTVGTETGTDGSLYKYAEFAPNGAKTVTAYYTVNSSDTESSGSFGTWNGSAWLQEDFDTSVSGGQCSVTYNVPSDVGATVKFSVYWPGADNVEITKIVLDNGSSSVQTTETTKQSVNTTVTTKATTASSSNNSDDKDANITIGTEEGIDGKIYKYAEFAPNGAKSATAYFKVSSDDTEASGSFGTWTGEWLQEDFNISVPSDGACSVDYTIPSNAGETVKFSVYWPGADSVEITKVVLHYGSTVTTGNGSTTTQSPTGNGQYTVNLNQSVDYFGLPVDDKMIGWEWAQFGIPENENITKVEINIKAKSGEIGKWQGAFGSSTSVDPDYWTQTEDMEQTFSSKSGTIAWDIDSATSSIIQRAYGGELKFGIWWIDCAEFTIESITVYTDAYSGSNTTTTSSQVTTKETNNTTKTTAATTKNTAAATSTATSIDLPAPTILGDINLDGKVDISDAVLLNKAVAGAVKLNEQQFSNADVCTDVGVGTSDAVTLLKFLVSLVKSLPAD